MRSCFLVAALLLSGCNWISDAGQPLAQCKLAAGSDAGISFRSNYLEGQQPEAGDVSYREYMLTCMEAKGWDFQQPSFTGEADRCWLPDPKGGIPDANVDEVDCYR